MSKLLLLLPLLFILTGCSSYTHYKITNLYNDKESKILFTEWRSDGGWVTEKIEFGHVELNKMCEAAK